MIYIKPESGLANRIRALISALALSKKLKQKLVVVWGKENGFNGTYENLFAPSKAFTVVKTNRLYELVFYTGNRKSKLLLQKAAHKLLKIDLLLSDKDMKEFVWDFGGNDINIDLVNSRRKKNLAIKTCHEFYFRSGLLHEVKPASEIETNANLSVSDFNNTIGLHIRRTDNIEAISKSPLQLFIDNIRREIEKNKNVKFYLATDDVSVYDELVELFPGVIIYRPKVLDRNSEQGIKDAFTDMIILSKCSRIYGSYYSSFSSVAAAYGTVPITIVKKIKKILIISPHFPPSNLAAVHRSRLFVQHLSSFGWHPVILMVNEKNYEEALDMNLHSLLPTDLQIEKANAIPLTKPRVIGDIGLRSFFQLYKKAKQIIKKEQIDFVYIPIPSFYVALLGRWLNKSTGVAYGIDYIDPWVHIFPGSEKMFSRHWFTTQLAKILEPIAVKNASLITGVAEGYYRGVQQRNPHLMHACLFGAMPYGGEKTDHEKVKGLGIETYLFKKQAGKIQLVYAGAMLPKAYQPLEKIFKVISNRPDIFSSLQIHFIGTGKSPNDANGYNIKPVAEKYGLWENVIFEYPKRIPYLDTLVHLNAADGIFILGSTEPHYTPSKAYQGILSEKPILAVLHEHSTAVNILKQSGGGMVLPFNGEQGLEKIEKDFAGLYASYVNWIPAFSAENIDQEVFEQYSAKEVTRKLVHLLDEVVK